MQTLIQLVQQARKTQNRTARRALSNRIIQQARSNPCPVIQSEQVLFIAIHDTAKKIALAGEWTYWKQTLFERIPDTPLRTHLATFPLDARLEYKLVIDEQWLLDPLNPNKTDNGVGGENSWFAMPRYREVSIPLDAHAPPGALERFAWQPKGFHPRTISVYQPAQAGGKMPVLYFHDGTEYLNRAGAARVLDTLIHRRRIQPLIAVFTPPFYRMSEYLHQRQAYLEQFATDLTAKIAERFPISVQPTACGTAGASLGGFISLLLALDYPERFGNVISQSGSFQVDSQGLLSRIKSLPGSGRFWFDYGTYESSLTEINQQFRAILKKEQRVKFKSQNQGHNWSAWRQRLPEAIQWLQLKSDGSL